ncbi:hypothetical protein SUDANB6_05938 [Streptomyces sp. enrichment culture]
MLLGVRDVLPPVVAVIDPTASGEAHGEGCERITVQEHWEKPEEIVIAHGGRRARWR